MKVKCPECNLKVEADLFRLCGNCGTYLINLREALKGDEKSEGEQGHSYNNIY